jgi:transcriptional regulator with XRE-family HTH domain
MANSLKSFADNMNRFLKNRSMSQKELCRLAGIDQTGLGRWLNGKTVPRLDQLDKIADVLEVNAYELIGPSIPSGGSPQAKLSAAALLLSDSEAALLLDYAQNFLLKKAAPPKKAQEK